MANPATRMTYNDSQLRRHLRQLIAQGTDFTRPLLTFRQYMAVAVDSLFDVLSYGRGNATHRGVSWPGFAPQYTRQDGTVVPAWGGIPKVRGKGMVKGRKRPSGTRLTPVSAIMQDTGNLRGKAITALFRQTKTAISFGTPESVNYAGEQAARRPYLFFYLPQDKPALRQILLDWLRQTGRLVSGRTSRA